MSAVTSALQVSVAIILLMPHSLGALIVGVGGLGLCMASVFPAVLSLASERVHLTGQMTGSFITGASLGAMVSSIKWCVGPSTPGSHAKRTIAPRVQF